MIESRSIILDYFADGNENVPSEDFDPGFGCVIAEPVRILQPPPPVIDTLTVNDRLNIAYLHESEREREAREDGFLERHGIK